LETAPGVGVGILNVAEPIAAAAAFIGAGAVGPISSGADSGVAASAAMAIAAGVPGAVRGDDVRPGGATVFSSGVPISLDGASIDACDRLMTTSIAGPLPESPRITTDGRLPGVDSRSKVGVQRMRALA